MPTKALIASDRSHIPHARLVVAFVCGLSFPLATCINPTIAFAAELPGPALDPELRATLASVVLLSDAAMAKQKGTSLPASSVGQEAARPPTILLWDELRTGPLIAPQIGGTGAGVSGSSGR